MAIIKASDQITIVDVTDGYSVDLSSNSYVFGGTADGQVTSTQTIETIIQATRGADVPSIDVDQNAIDIRPVNNGVTATYSVETVGGKNIHKVTIQATVATREAGTVTIPVKLDGGEGNGGVTINKVFSFNIAKAGSSIVDVQNWYLATSASSGVTKDTAGWTTTIQQMTAENQYLWNYEVTYGTGQIELDSTSPVIIGRYGQDGSAGKSIDRIVEWYQISAISATPPATPSEAGTGYERNPQVTSVNTPYLWNYEVIYYTDDTYTVTNARIIGVHGLTGPAGTGISSTIIKYAVNTSSTTPPVSFPTGSDWHDDVQPTITGQYLWTGMKFIYDDPTVESLPVYTVAAHGTPATTYHLQSSADAIIKPQTGSLNPSSITFSSYQQTGNDNPLTYTGDFGIAVSTNGSTFGTETIITNVDHVDYTPGSTDRLIKCTLYKLGTGSGSNKVTYDTQTIPVLSDGKSATQYYTYIRYSENPNGQDYVPTPTADTKYIGVCVTTSSIVPAYNSTDWKWSLYVGANGYNTATKYIYKRLGTAPSSAPADSTYTFSDGTISNMPSGWTENIPEQNQNGDPCYVTSATAISQEDTGTLDWAVPTLFIENAYNSATIYLYKRGETSPAGPSGSLTYDFTTGQLTPSTALNGWSLTVPVDSTAPCWVIMATVLTNVDTDTIADTEWSTPIRIDGKDGAKGLNQATVFYYKRSASAPNISSDNPGSVTYTFETGASASPSNTWYRAIPTSDGTPCWVTSASAIGRENTVNIASDKWSAATKLVEDGADAYTIILTNENHTFAGDTTSALEDSTTCGIIAYKGEDTINTRVRVANITGIPTGMTITASGGNNYVANNVLTIEVNQLMNSRGGTLTIPVEVTGGKTFNMNFTYSLSLIGEPATAYKLIVSNAAIVKTASGYTPASITLSSKKQTGSASMENYSGKFKVEKTTDGSAWTKVYVSDSPESSYSCSIPANIKALRCLLYTSDSTFNSEGALTGGTLLDQQVVPIVTDGINGEPAYTVILSNENHTFQGNNTAALNSSTECEIIAYKGASKIVSTIGTITGVPDGMNINISNSATTSTLSKFTITVSPDAEHLLTSGGGVLSVPVIVDGKVFNMNFTYSVAFKGDTGAAGRNGTDGYNTATVYLYKRSEAQPTGNAAKPNNTLTYTFSSKALTPSTALNGWSAEVPTTGTAPCWLISATANANTAQDTIPTTEWSVPIRIDGIDGIDGLNQATLFYYKRSVNAPNTNPGSITYTFADASTTTVSDNWTKTIPTSDGNPCWVVSAVAISREGTVNIPSTAWSTPSKIVEDGKDGDSATAYSLIISAAAITKAINGAYTPSTITLNSKKQTGNEQIADYPARFKIETTSNGVDWSTSSSASGLYYQSSTNESSTTFTITGSIIALRCSLYAAGGFTTLLDQQIVPIVEDGSDSYTVILSDENHTFAGTDTAAIASTASCDVMVYKGSTEVIATIGTIQYPSNMSVDIYTGSTDPFVWPRFTVSVNNSFNTRNGTLNIPITVVDNGQRLSFTKVFTYSLALNGSSPVVRELEVSQAAIARDEDGNYTPSTLTLKGKQQVGNNNPSAYSGRFLIEKTTDGSTWTEVEHSSTNESTHTLSTIPFGISALRCTLYASGGLTTQLDQQVVPIVEDGSDSYTVILSNESHTYAGTDSYPVVPATVISQVIAYRGSDTVYVRIGTITCPTGMTITPNYPNPYAKGNISLTINTGTTFNTVSGTINIPVKVNPFGDPNSSEYEDYTQEFTKVFTFTTALKGQAAEIYMLDVDNATVTKRGGEYTPGSIVVTSKRKVGNGTPTTYNKWFRIETSAKGDGTDWSTSQSGSALYYQSTNAEATHTFNLNNSYSIKAIRCTLYDSSSFNVILDQQIVPIISDGYNSATIYLYKLSASQPLDTDAKPSGTLTYNFSNGTLTPSTSLNGWSQAVQTGSNPCWMIVATTISSEVTDTIATSEWSTPIRIDGAQGTPGQPGAHGYNTATVYFYKRTNTTPASTDRPGTSQYLVTYDFTTGETSSSASTPYFGWSRDIPTSNGSTCWVTSGIALSQESTVTINAWADPTKLVEDGEDAYTITLSNENASFPGQPNKVQAAEINSQTTCDIKVYKGTTLITSYVGSSTSATSISTGITGLTCSISNNNTTSPRLTFTASPSSSSLLTTLSGSVNIPIHANGQTFTKQFIFNVTLTGENGPQGPQGNGIDTTEIKYAKSTNGTTPPQNESDWKSSVDLVGTINPGEYLWTRTTITYTDERTPTKSYSVAAYGQDGIDTITLSVGSSNGWQITGSNITTTLTAKVFKGITEKTISSAGVVADSLGTVKWYKTNTSSTPTSSNSISVSEGSSVDKVIYIVQLENNNSLIARTEVTVSKLKSILSTYVFYCYTPSSNIPSEPTDAQVKYYIANGQFQSGVNWSDSEPTTVESSYALYRVEYTYYSDLSLTHSTVTKDSSYEAANVAIEKVDNIKIGGRNLLRLSDRHVSTAEYSMINYYFGEDVPQVDDEVTIQIKGTLGSGKTSFGVYNSGGSVKVFDLNSSHYDSNTGIYTRTGPWKVSSAANTFVRIYQLPSSISGVTSTIEWIKLERGNKATDWSPAPEDLNRSLMESLPASNVYGVMSKSLIMKDSTGKWASLTQTGGTGESKAINDSGFFMDKVYYSVSDNGDTTAVFKNTNTRTVYSSYYGVDLRYSLNFKTTPVQETLTLGSPVYIVGSISNQDNMFHLLSDYDTSSSYNRCWTQTPPSGSITEYDSTVSYAVGDYTVYKYIPTFSSSNNYGVGEYVIYNNKYYMCVAPVVVDGSVGEWNAEQWVEVFNIPGKDLYRCTAATSGGDFNPDNWYLVTDNVYIYLGVANSTTSITLEENNTIFKWNSETGFTDYSLYLTSTYNSELNKLNDRIESKVSQSTYSALQINVDNINNDLDPGYKNGYAAKVADQFTKLKQTANSFSISLYGASIDDYSDAGTGDVPAAKDGSIEQRLEAQETALEGSGGLKDKLRELSHATGYTKPDPSNPDLDITGADIIDYFSFEPQGLIIGDSGSNIVLRAQNNNIAFINLSTNEKLVTIDTTGMHSQENVLSEQVNMFNNWALRKGGSGTTGTVTTYNLNDVWTGG